MQFLTELYDSGNKKLLKFISGCGRILIKTLTELKL